MRRMYTVALMGASAVALPASASAATVALDKPCYISGRPGIFAGFGFAPNAVISINNADLGPTTVTTDPTGSFAQGFTPPDGRALGKPGSRDIVFTAAEVANPASTASATSKIAPLAFATNRGTKSPKADRSWSFSGWKVGKPIYAHFRFRGKTKRNFRMGVATGPCGEFKRRAPGIAVRGRVSAGLWTIQVDQRRTYSRSTMPALKDQTTVFTRFRPRAVTSAAALSAAALNGRFSFRGY